MAGVSYAFVAQTFVESLQLPRCIRRNDAIVADDEEHRDRNGAHQLAIVGVGRVKNLKSADAGLQPRIDNEFDSLGRAAGVAKPRLSQRVSLARREKSAMLLDHIALVNFSLALGAQKSRVGEDDAANR